MVTPLLFADKKTDPERLWDSPKVTQEEPEFNPQFFLLHFCSILSADSLDPFVHSPISYFTPPRLLALRSAPKHVSFVP